MCIRDSPRSAFLRSKWNMFEFVVIFHSVLDTFAFSSGVSAISTLKLFRSVRSLRVLRLIVRSPYLRMILTSWFKVFPALFNVILLVIPILLTISLVGQHLFSGILRGCRLQVYICLLYTSPSPRDRQKSRMPSSA
eukprot:TRINITY_DN21322_c0_g1_i1.p1 TRINITY_DN21322_c0_g1~~TRINITY_DN21322_c0_g1_i1.p1  ORF type:complete len:145 (+),score=19.18 TRINITY_DN21322_c0_g1_i1:29-436(+)